MRFIGQTLLLLVTLSLVFFGLKGFLGAPIALANIPYAVPADLDLQLSRGYLLTRDGPLTFNLTKGDNPVWIATAARVLHRQADGAALQYVINFEFFDDNGKLLLEHRHESMVELEPQVAFGSKSFPRRFFSSDDDLIAQSRSVHFNDDVLRLASRLQLSAQSLDPQLSDVAVRVYQRERQDRQIDPRLTWQRLSQSEKDLKSRGLALPSDFLTEQEKIALGRFRWDPVAPNGVPGADYQSLILYTVEHPNGFWPESQGFSHVNNLADVEKSVTFPIHFSDRVTLKISHDFESDRPYEVTVLWYPSFAALPWQKTYQLSESEVSISEEFGRGLIEVKSNVPIEVAAVSDNPDSVPEDRHFQTAYVMDSQQKLEFSLQREPGQLLPLRLDVRHFQAYELDHKPLAGTATYQWLDAEGRVIKQGNFVALSVPDRYQQLILKEPFDQLSAKNSRFFLLPEAVKSFRVTANQAMLVNVSVSPLALDYSRRLPAEERLWFDDLDSKARWFPLKPQQWQELEHSGKSLSLRFFHRPVMVSPELLDGSLRSQALSLSSSSLAWRELMVPYDSDRQLLAGDSHYLYSPLSRTGELRREPNLSQAPASLFFVRPSEQPRQLSIFADGLSLQRSWLASRWGRLRLDDLSADARSLKLTANDGRWFINQHQPASGGFQLRKAMPITAGQSLVFNLQKQHLESSVLLRYFSGTDRTAVIEMKVDMPLVEGVYPAFTPRYRRWLLDSKADLSGYVLESNRRVASEYKMVFPLLADVPQKHYRLTVRMESGGSGYVALNQMQSVPEIDVSVFKGSEADHE